MANVNEKVMQIVDTLMKIEDKTVLRGVQEELARRLTVEIAEVTHAHELSDEQRSQIVEAIKKQFDYSGDVTFTLDESLGAGIKVQVGDYVFENSAKDTLQQLSAEINK